MIWLLVLSRFWVDLGSGLVWHPGLFWLLWVILASGLGMVLGSGQVWVLGQVRLASCLAYFLVWSVFWFGLVSGLSGVPVWFGF